jgi:hypothetical protein
VDVVDSVADVVVTEDAVDDAVPEEVVAKMTRRSGEIWKGCVRLNPVR